MPGFVSSISNSNEAVFANNADFTGSSDPTELNGLQTNGQLWIGSTSLNAGSTHINVGSLTSPDSSISIGYSSPNITLQASSSLIKIINGDTGSITGNIVTIFANNAANNAGASVKFINSGTVSTFNLTDANGNTLLGKLTGNLTLTGVQNTAVGSGALVATTTGSYNSALGLSSLGALTTGISNVSVGYASCAALTTGSQNISLGYFSLDLLLTGNNNIALQSGHNYTSSESNNILIWNAGVLGESNKIRIGTSGSGAGQQNQTFIAGITGVTAAGSPVAVSSTGQLSDLGFGTAAQVLTSNGAGVSPTWQAASGFTAVNWAVQLSTNTGNVTGDNTQYKILYDTVIFDSASGYNTGTHIYTVPTTGKYNISVFNSLGGGGVASTLFLSWISLNGAAYPGIRMADCNSATLGLAVNGEFILESSILLSLTSGDTLEIYVDVIGGTKNVNITGGSSAGARFSGFRVA